MTVARRLPTPAVIGAAAIAAGLCGALLVRSDQRSFALLGLVALGALAVVALEMPLLLFGALLFMIGAFPEDVRSRLLPGLGVWQWRIIDFSLAEILLGLLCVSAAVFWASHAAESVGIRGWPGLPATFATAFAVVAIGSAISFHQVRAGVHVAEPAILLATSLIVGYWVAIAHGTSLPLTWLVYASVLLIPQGLYDALAANELSYYDASPILLLGFGAILVAFRIVELNAWRIPYLAVASLVIVLSLRRGAWLAIVAALVITGIWSRRSGFRTALAIGAVCVLGLELVHSGSAFAPIEHAVQYTTGQKGREFSTDYREFEMANAWLNVKHNWLGGIGPATDWTLYNSYNMRYRPYNFSYLHNSYLWVWLRWGLLGLIAYVGFLAVSALALLGRRRLPIESVVAGGTVVGASIAVFTASYLTTTARWPITVGLIVGIGLAARARATQAERAAAADDAGERRRNRTPEAAAAPASS
jgi:O-antigen ligase